MPLPLVELAVAAASPIIERAFGSAVAYLSEAQEASAHSATACRNYLQAVRAAMEGLELESLEILIEARYLPADDPTAVRKLQARLERYLRGRRLLPIIERASEGLDICHNELRATPDRFFEKGLDRSARQIAVDGLATVIENIAGYTRCLMGEMGATGYAVNDLATLKYHLDEGNVPEATRWADSVLNRSGNAEDAARAEFNKRVERVIRELARVFRQPRGARSASD